MHNRTFIPMIAALVTLGACQLDPKNIGTPDSTDTTDTGPSTETGPTTGAGPTTGVDESTTEASTTTTTSGTTGPVEGDCPCILDNEKGDEVALPTCAESLCAVVEVGCGIDCPDFMLQTPEALTCALEALRDRTPGLLRWSFNVELTNDAGYVWIHDDGSAIRRNWGGQDLTYVVGPAQIVELPDSEVYAQCLADASDQARFDCLRQMLANEQDPVCDAGWQIEGI